MLSGGAGGGVGLSWWFFRFTSGMRYGNPGGGAGGNGMAVGRGSTGASGSASLWCGGRGTVCGLGGGSPGGASLGS